MVIQILGSAAGGGVPQWNCGCRQCDAARSGLIQTRSQCSVAITSDERRWVLINASPDLRTQLARLRSQPPSRTRRPPIESVLLSDADLDHTLGLFLLRESNWPVSIHASLAIHHSSCRLFYVIRESATGKSVLLAPGIAKLEPQLWQS
jgi:pyrroloquinoline quinone biosynthesis protein B